MTGWRGLVAGLTLWPACALPCDTALLLAIDVSNSVDEAEYRLQTDGLADALADAEVVEAMVQGQVMIAVMQWSGVDRQVITTPWTQVMTEADAAALSVAARITPRAIRLSDTAPAEAIRVALRQFAEVADCARHIIDMSGDGTPNAGSDVAFARQMAERQGVTINGIAIESLGMAVTGFYLRNVVTRDGFVVTAGGHRDYPDAIRRKIIRELARVIG
ncbi:MAG: DUF1194 domain-containing protein [Rhodobacterales bacterium]|nr:DUF1194 domain-containing protein [Rhodobacterales bacterium]NCT11913.1 DUF1194 domain-containing protein [Rhodobacterales bacterium]